MKHFIYHFITIFTVDVERKFYLVSSKEKSGKSTRARASEEKRRENGRSIQQLLCRHLNNLKGTKEFN